MFKKKVEDPCKRDEKDQLKDVHRRLDSVERRVDYLEKQRQVMRRKI